MGRRAEQGEYVVDGRGDKEERAEAGRERRTMWSSESNAGMLIGGFGGRRS